MEVRVEVFMDVDDEWTLIVISFKRWSGEDRVDTFTELKRSSGQVRRKLR